jgi:monoamine oxidase
MQEVDVDVIVIGAGFAGLTAARECANRGLSTVILEGRSRIGGRTYSMEFGGRVVELGGTTVYWTQPHLWAEITRYNLDVEAASDEIDHMARPDAKGELVWGSPDDYYSYERGLVNEYFAPTREIFPVLTDPLFNKEAVARWDISAEERLQQLDNLSEDDIAFLRSNFSLWVGGDLEQGGFLAMARWIALGGYDYGQVDSMLLGNKIVEGTSALHQAILEDSGAILELSTVVTEVDADDHGVRVTTRDGKMLSAQSCVVATPSGCWADIKFTPQLAENRLRVARGSLLSAPAVSSTKMILKGEPRGFFILAPYDHPIGDFHTVMQLDGDRQIASCGQHPSMKNAADSDEVIAAVKDLLPHVEVEELATETYYTDNPLNRGGWPMHRAGVLSREEPHVSLSQPEGRVAFATSDISKFWTTFIDGAIESGITAGRHVREIIDAG